MLPRLNLVVTHGVPILEQLRREEALLRASRQNWCILVDGCPPAIVLGAFNSPQLLVDTRRLQLPLVRRYSGGGTVVVDRGTYFVCWVLNADETAIEPYPEAILRWVYQRLKKAMRPLELQLHEQDFCLQKEGVTLKVAGNAQAVIKGRFAHHCSLLWDYQEQHMEQLLLPSRQPVYRSQRSHREFLYCLKNTPLTRGGFQQQLAEELSRHFQVQQLDYQQLDPYLQRPHRSSCRIEEIESSFHLTALEHSC